MSRSLFDFEAEEKLPVGKSLAKESLAKKPPVEELPAEELPESVTELTLRVKGILEAGFGDVWVVGEVSNFSRPKSGHVYFTLKDKNASISAIIWQSSYSRLRFKIEEGMELVCRGRVEVYPPHGRYQLILKKVEPRGVGGLELAFRQLRDKLGREGLFDLSRKRSIPPFVKNIALITSLTGAAVRDFLQVLRRRTLLVDVLLVPVQVQGEGSAAEIVSAIGAVHEVSRYRRVDCIVIVRGGGSAEDLWTFNEEILVRAVAGSEIPVISGIGHEVDVTLCDLVADVRALTPSEAAERVAREDAELGNRILQLGNIIERNIDKKIRDYKNLLNHYGKHPIIIKPQRIIENKNKLVTRLDTTINDLLDRNLERLRQRMTKNVTALEALSPLATLTRGYSITESKTGKILRSIKEINPKDTIKTRLKDGQFKSNVTEIISGEGLDIAPK
jgi:exodeoxyribonuclease VII large subunit